MGLKATLEKIKNGELTSINLGDKSLNTEDILHLSNALMDANCKLTSIDLKLNKLTDEVSNKINTLLAANRSKVTELTKLISSSTLERLHKSQYSKGFSYLNHHAIDWDNAPHKGHTPLTLAILKADYQTIRWMLANGCNNFSTRCSDNTYLNKTPLQIANLKGRHDIVALLKFYMYGDVKTEVKEQLEVKKQQEKIKITPVKNIYSEQDIVASLGILQNNAIGMQKMLDKIALATIEAKHESEIMKSGSSLDSYQFLQHQGRKLTDAKLENLMQQKETKKIILQMQKKSSKNDLQDFIVGGNEVQVMVSKNSQDSATNRQVVNTRTEMLVVHEKLKNVESVLQDNTDKTNQHSNTRNNPN
ncbi:MAG: hypothetical protein JKX98_09905 [Alcanivoracaceae bacterium]|nr:hypothetical protein [Alcanivoracaceae bacterium]